MIRSATERDVETVVDLWRTHGGPTRSSGQEREARALLTRDPDALIVAVDGEERVVASLIVGWDGWRCHLYRLVVEPRNRREGVATALLAEARERARGLGCTRLDAMVHRENRDAVAFWESCGFEMQDDDGRWSVVL